LESTPEKTASAGSGIARYPSGIQPWSGKAGILTRKAAAKQRKIPFSCEALAEMRLGEVAEGEGDVVCPALALSTPVAIAAVSISSSDERVA